MYSALMYSVQCIVYIYACILYIVRYVMYNVRVCVRVVCIIVIRKLYDAILYIAYMSEDVIMKRERDIQSEMLLVCRSWDVSNKRMRHGVTKYFN